MILSKSSFGNTSNGTSFCHCYAVKDCNAVRKISFDIVEKVHVYWNDICPKMGRWSQTKNTFAFILSVLFCFKFCLLFRSPSELTSFFYRSCEVEI